MSCSEFSANAKDRITIQSPSETADSYGGRTVTWSDVVTCWAWIQPVSGRELFAQDATQSRITHKIVIRWQSGLNDIRNVSDYRVSFDGKLFGLKASLNLDRDMKSYGKEYQQLLVEENAPDV